MLCVVLATTPLNAESQEFVQFSDVSASSGLLFNHENGMEAELWLAKILGAGVAVLDFDQDGLLDIWLIQGGPLNDRSNKHTLPSDRLYKNISVKNDLRFKEVTNESGVDAREFGIGIATGYIDNDGDLDVFLANFDANQVFENMGNGRFFDITPKSRIRGDSWSVAASFADYDNDGLIDLYVANYVDFTVDTHKTCYGISPKPDYCSLKAYDPVTDRLYKNLGEGIFKDVTH